MKGLSFLFAILLAILTGCARVGGEERLVLDAERGLHVSGTAIVRSTPEVVTVEVGHAATTGSASEARASVDTVMEKVIAAVAEKGVAAEDVQTVQYSLAPQHDQKGRLVGWRMVNIVHLRIRQVDEAGEVIDAAVRAGATHVRNISYTIEDVERLKSQARDEAIAAAKAKAEQIANALGVQVGKPTAVTEDEPYYQSAYKYDSAAAPETVADAPGGVVTAGTVVVRLNVNVTFEIE